MQTNDEYYIKLFGRITWKPFGSLWVNKLWLAENVTNKLLVYYAYMCVCFSIKQPARVDMSWTPNNEAMNHLVKENYHNFGEVDERETASKSSQELGSHHCNCTILIHKYLNASIFSLEENSSFMIKCDSGVLNQ